MTTTLPLTHLPIVNDVSLITMLIVVVVFDDVAIGTEENALLNWINENWIFANDAPNFNVTIAIVWHEAESTTTTLLQHSQ